EQTARRIAATPATNRKTCFYFARTCLRLRWPLSTAAGHAPGNVMVMSVRLKPEPMPLLPLTRDTWKGQQQTSGNLPCTNEIWSIRDDTSDPHRRTGCHHPYIISGKRPNFKSFRFSSGDLGGPDNLGMQYEDLRPQLLGNAREVVVPLFGQ